MPKTKRIAFNKTALDSLPAPDAGRVYVYDSKVRGLCVCCTATGAKTFYLYRRMEGKPTRYRIGEYPQVTVQMARDIAEKRIGEVADGRNPHRERIQKRTELTLTKLFERWVAEYAKVKRKSWRIDDKRFRRYVEPEFGDRALAAIDPEELLTWHRKIGEEHGRVIANRMLLLVSAVYSWACRFRIFRGENPAKLVDKFPEISRERFLQPDELPRFFAALHQEDHFWQDYFRLLLLTGARKSNLRMMRWEEIRGAVWTVPRGNAKSGKPIEIPLVDEALTILESRRQMNRGSAWVFPARKGDACFKATDRVWYRVVKRAGLENLTIHDLRRTYGSYQALAGSSLVEIGKSLGHAPGSKATSIYARLTHDAVRESAERGVARMLAAAKGGNGDDQ